MQDNRRSLSLSAAMTRLESTSGALLSGASIDEIHQLLHILQAASSCRQSDELTRLREPARIRQASVDSTGEGRLDRRGGTSDACTVPFTADAQAAPVNVADKLGSVASHPGKLVPRIYLDPPSDPSVQLSRLSAEVLLDAMYAELSTLEHRIFNRSGISVGIKGIRIMIMTAGMSRNLPDTHAKPPVADV